MYNNRIMNLIYGINTLRLTYAIILIHTIPNGVRKKATKITCLTGSLNFECYMIYLLFFIRV